MTTPLRTVQRHPVWAVIVVLVLAVSAIAGRALARRSRVDALPPQLSALVAAIGATRTIEPRLSGGFAYGSTPSPSRSAVRPLDAYSPDIRIAVAEIEKLEMTDRSPDALALLGLAYLSVGDANRAVPALEEAAAVPSSPARVRSDLAAAYLVRSLDINDAQDLPKALAAADLAAKSDPSLAEAQFNRALALERLHLTAESQQAWRTYLRLDGSSAWASEARSRMIAVSAPGRPSVDEERRAIGTAAADDDPSVVRTAVERSVQPAREWTESQVLARWSEAVLSAGDAQASAALRGARRVAESIAATTGDRYPIEAVAAAERAGTSRVNAVALAHAHVAFTQATTQYDNNEFAASGRAFAAIVETLAHARSPFALAARLQVAISAYYASDIDGSARDLDELIPAAERAHYTRLVGLASRMRGLVEFVQARYGRSLEHNLHALESFEAVGDRESVAAIESSLAENLEFLGEPRTAWMHRARALAGLANVRNLRRRHTMLISSVLSCLRQGSPEAAAYFQSAVLDNATRWNRPEALAEAHVRQAELHGQLGEFARVSSDLAEARRWLSLAPAGAATRQIEARALLASASFSNRAHSYLDASALTEALAYLQKAGNNWALAKAHLARGRAYVAQGRPDLAEHDFLEGIQEFEKQRGALTAESMRVSYFDQPWDLFSEMVRLQTTTRRRPDVALSFAERGRARTLFEAVSRSEQAVPLDAATLQARLDPGVALIYYAVLDYEVVVWRLTRSRLESFESTITESDLTRWISRFRSELDGETSRQRELGAQLYDLLVRAAVRDLPASTTLVFIPDGVLHALPFAALVDRGTGRYLVEDRPIAVAPSGSVFIEATSSLRRGAVPGGRTALVIGNPRTGAPGQSALPDLPDAGREAIDVAALYAAASAKIAVDATKQQFLDQFDQHDIVHFAGHAVSNSDFPALSRLVFANAASGAGDSLFVHELAGRRFQRTQVLVLAACQTSGGRIRRGEGVLSLARPFLAAGVPTVVASLWDADDQATRALLVAFHTALRRGEAPATALRSAQLHALASKDSHLSTPSKWAGFEVIGSVGMPSPNTSNRF